jgi:hypothetical protein
MTEPLFRYETRQGEPVLVAGRRITLLSKALVIRLPGFNGGLIWNRPASVLVTSEDGQEQSLPVVDVTRMAIWNMLGASMAFFLVIGLFRLVRRKPAQGVANQPGLESID